MKDRFSGERLAALRLRGVVGLIVGVAFVTAVVAAFVEYAVDPGIGSLGDSLWWAVATVTTTGYGDVVPTSTAGRLVGTVLMLVGISLIPTITSLIVTVFVAQKQKEQTEADRKHRDEVIERLDRLEQQLTASTPGTGPVSETP